jgi:hypothetical protein
VLLVHKLRRFSSWLDPLEPCRVATGRPRPPSVKDAVVNALGLDVRTIGKSHIHCKAFFELT